MVCTYFVDLIYMILTNGFQNMYFNVFCTMVKVVLYVQIHAYTHKHANSGYCQPHFRFSLIIVEEVVVLRVSNRGLAQNTQAKNLKRGTGNL